LDNQAIPDLPTDDEEDADAKQAVRYAGLTSEAIRAIQERNYATGLKVWWARDFGFLALLDPFTGEVYEVERTKETPRWMTWRAMEEKQRRQPGRGSARARPPWPGWVG
jgi:hypothetical protein